MPGNKNTNVQADIFLAILGNNIQRVGPLILFGPATPYSGRMLLRAPLIDNIIEQVCPQKRNSGKKYLAAVFLCFAFPRFGNGRLCFPFD
jgi:hypothetical protein